MNERDPKVGRYLEMREIAGALCRETEHTEGKCELDLRTMVVSLCSLSVNHKSYHHMDYDREGWGAEPDPWAGKVLGWKNRNVSRI
jgi:hypothetical protein